MNTNKEIARLRAFMIARRGDIKRAVQFLIDAGVEFAKAVRVCFAHANGAPFNHA